ncbi:MAG: phosphate regulon sensor histidine kinase PhoR [Comamonadaceae bacterium]|nr:MAG: phosphate regulon sensor histidine kinase PhoR [Comamonadaceae bacterium]
MFFRLITFVLFQFAGGFVGWWLPGRWIDNWPGAAAGVVVGGALWVLVDLVRGARVLAWLRGGESAKAPSMRGLWGEVSDRTRRLLRNREQDTRASEARLQEFLAAIQASPNGVVLLDDDGRIEWCNLTAAGHFGFDAQRDVLQLIGNLVRDPAFAAYWAGGDYSQEIFITSRGGAGNRPVRISVHLHPYGHGRRLLLSRDVTALEQAETMRRDFVANVSHEIRTPLTVLSGFVETLQTLPLNADERSRYLGMMSQQAHRMQTLVNDLLTLSKLEGSPPPGAGEWVPAATLLVQCEQEARELSQLLTGDSHELSFECHNASEVSGSHSELLSAMSNLVSNAVRYTPPGESIRVTWDVLPDGRAEFAVKDRGPGIASEHISRLTERFYRVDRSRSRETGGTGLGLAIVKHVVQRHGSELRIDSTPGQGSTFSIVFPASRVRLVAQAAPVALPATEAPQKQPL